MKINSCNNVAVLRIAIAAVAMIALLWPATGDAQTSSRRERYRRDASTRSSSSRTERGPRQTSEPNAPATRPAEPNAAGAKPTASAQPVVTPSAEGFENAEPGSWASYGIILQRNIFSRQRTPFRPREKSSAPQAVVKNPETHFVLKGVVQENDAFTAFIEDTEGGGVLRLRQGDRVARGVIKTLSLDSLEYQLEDKTVSISLGCDLEGTRGIATMSTASMLNAWQSSTPAAAATPAGQQGQAQPSAPSGAEADILKRLMEQRKQQLGQ